MEGRCPGAGTGLGARQVWGSVFPSGLEASSPNSPSSLSLSFPVCNKAPLTCLLPRLNEAMEYEALSTVFDKRHF